MSKRITHDLVCRLRSILLYAVVVFVIFIIACADIEGLGSNRHNEADGSGTQTNNAMAGGRINRNTEVVSDYEGFNFTEQGFRPAKGTVQPGDVIQTRCAWTNTSDAPVTFGENTNDEMCFNFVGYYPAIPAYPWVTPSLATACVPEVGL